MTDPNFGRLLLERYGVPRERFVGNMLVLAGLLTWIQQSGRSR